MVHKWAAHFYSMNEWMHSCMDSMFSSVTVAESFHLGHPRSFASRWKEQLRLAAYQFPPASWCQEIVLPAMKTAGISPQSLYIRRSIIPGAKCHCWNGFPNAAKKNIINNSNDNTSDHNNTH